MTGAAAYAKDTDICLESGKPRQSDICLESGKPRQSKGNNPAGERAARAAMRPLPRLVPAACWRNNLFGPTSREHEAFNARRQANRPLPSLSSLLFPPPRI